MFAYDQPTQLLKLNRASRLIFMSITGYAISHFRSIKELCFHCVMHEVQHEQKCFVLHEYLLHIRCKCVVIRLFSSIIISVCGISIEPVSQLIMEWSMIVCPEIPNLYIQDLNRGQLNTVVLVVP